MISWIRVRVEGGRRSVASGAGVSWGWDPYWGLVQAWGGVLGSPKGVVLESVKGFGDISGHGNLNCVVVIVPVNFRGEV
jgi:hypothetical protein